jgi:hypothetical protein
MNVCYTRNEELLVNIRTASEIEQDRLARKAARRTADETTILPAETVAAWFLDNHQGIDHALLADLTDLINRARHDGLRTGRYDR